MRTLPISNTAVNLAAQKVPFLSGYTFVAVNFTGGALIVQEADTASGTWSAVESSNSVAGTVRAGGADEITVRKQFVRVSTTANITLLGN
jgi:hypothetical protein